MSRAGLHTRYPKLYCSGFVVPTVKGVVLALPFFVFHNAAIYTTLSAALFHNRNSVTVEKNDGADGKVSRTLYKGLFHRAGPESPCSPELGKPGTQPQDLDAQTIPVFSLKVCNFEQSCHGVRGNTCSQYRVLLGGHGLASIHRHSDPHDRLFPAK